MMRVIFVVMCALVLIIPQISFRLSIGEVPLVCGMMTLLLIYVALNHSLVSGLVSAGLLGLLAEIFSQVPHGPVMLVNFVVFLGIQLVASRIFAEAYITKSLWVFPFSLLNQLLLGLVFSTDDTSWVSSFFWVSALGQSVFDAVLSFPLFVLLDLADSRWLDLTSIRNRNLKGADFYAVQSKQRRFFS